MGGGSKSQPSVSNIDLESSSMKLVASSSMKMAIIAMMVAAAVAVAAFVMLSDDDDAVIQGGAGRAAGTNGNGGIVVIDPCAAIDCGQGQCQSEDGTCECPSEYTGDVCDGCMPGYTLEGSRCVDKPECSSVPSPCGTANVASCTNAAPPETVPTCTCRTGYVFSGTACVSEDVCLTIDCGVGQCRTGTCECPDGYTGSLCEACMPGYGRPTGGAATCEPLDCGVFVQPTHGTVDGDTYYGATNPQTVSCNDGYMLIGTAELRCPASGRWPQEQPTCRANHCVLSQLTLNNAQIAGGCSSNGRCDVDSTLDVTCSQGMVLETTPPTCEPGSGDAVPSWSVSVVTCGTVDPCIGIQCGSLGTCVGGACQCNAGYSGDTCTDCAAGFTRRSASEPCIDVDECAGNPSPCVDTVGPLPDPAHTCNPVSPPDTSTTPHCQCRTGYDLTGGVCRPTLEHAIASRNAKIVAMRDAARQAYAAKCSVITSTCMDETNNDHCTDDACNPSTGWNSDEQCIHSDVFGTDALCTCAGAGRKMDAVRSTVTVNKRVDRNSPVVKDAVCFSKGLDSQFRDNIDSDAGVQFQWFASEAGPLRTFPGDARQLPSYSGDRPDNRGIDRAFSMADRTTAPWLTVNDESGARITDDMTCADCVAQGFECSTCIKYGFECDNTCSGATEARLRLIEDAKYCNWNDPREQSWYVSAVSGPKDIVVVLDLSVSMSQCAGSGAAANCETRLDVAKVAVRRVLETLSERDYAQIIPFGNFASCYDPLCEVDCVAYNTDNLCISPDNKLLQMTQNNRGRLLQYLTEMTIADGAPGNSFRKGFDKAFDVLDNSVADATAGCTKAVLFFTDGASTREGASNPDTQTEVIRQYDNTWQAVKQRNKVDTPAGATGPHQAHVFWYSVTRPPSEFNADDRENLYCPTGTGCTPWHDLMGNTFLASLNAARYNPPYAKKITCQNEGIYSHIRDPSMIEDALATYYQFLSRAAPSDTVRWSAIYTDATTGKEVIAGTLAVYTSGADPVLIGVVGMTVLVSSFDYNEPTRQAALLEILAGSAHSGNCVPRSRDLRTLERLRYTYGTRVITARNNAHDQAYEAERAADSFADGMARSPAGYFSTCCMNDDRQGFPPGSAVPAGWTACPPNNAGFCLETGINRPRNDYYDHEVCSADNYAGVPSFDEATIATDR